MYRNKTNILSGIFLGIGMVLYSIFIEYARRVQEREIEGYFILVLSLGLVYSIFRYRKEKEEELMTFKEGFKSIMFICLIVGLFFGVYTWSFVSFYDDSIIGILLANQKKVLEQGNYSKEQVVEFMNIATKIIGPTMLFFSAMLTVLFNGVLVGLPISIMLKKEKEVETFE